MIEKQLAAVYHALLATEPIAGTAPTKVITSYPIMGVGARLDPKTTEWCGTDTSKDNVDPSVWLVFHL